MMLVTKSGLRSRAGRRRAMVAAGVMAVLVVAGVASALPSQFVETDYNIVKDTAGTYDWANNGTRSVDANTGVVSVSGTGGIFNGGIQGATNSTPPTPPTLTATAAADARIVDADFIVDPLSSDTTACGAGDPSTFAGAGSETNGGLISSFTWGTAGNTPPKNDLSNVYALSLDDGDRQEIFFGAERVVNNGDSHIDFEFLQSEVTLTPASTVGGVLCGPGGFTGDRTQGDLLLAIDFTNGGTFGGSTLYQWQCDKVYDPNNDGVVCNPPANGKSVPHYEAVTSGAVAQALVFGVNSGANPIAGGGWAHRNADGSPRDDVIQNAFMEGAIDLEALGFDGCVQTLLPHTRSSQSFTAVLKDFTVVSFDTCREPGITTLVQNTNGTPETDDDSDVVNGGSALVGDGLYDTSSLTGATASAGGTVDYYVAKDDDTCDPLGADTTGLGSRTVTNGVVPASDTYTIPGAGTYYFWADYSGDAKNAAVISACDSELVVVVLEEPTIATQVYNTNGAAADSQIADDGHVSIGTVAYDTATLTDSTAGAGGTATYYVKKQAAEFGSPGYTPDCTTTGATQLGAKTVVAAVVPNSNNTSPLNVTGTYEFWVVYSGDANNVGTSSTCGSETVIVDPNSPTVATQVYNTNGAAADSQIADDGHVSIGTVAYDTATFTGATSDASGTATYYVKKQAAEFGSPGYTPDCTTTGATQLGAKTVANGLIPNSNNTAALTAAGTYEFWVAYGGDTNNNGATSTCGSETVIVDPNNPTLATQPSVQIRDSFSLSGLTSDATGSVTVKLFAPSDPDCDGAPALSATATIGTDGTFANGTFSFTTTYQSANVDGLWKWEVAYGGDPNNLAKTSACGVESVSIDITPNHP